MFLFKVGEIMETKTYAGIQADSILVIFISLVVVTVLVFYPPPLKFSSGLRGLSPGFLEDGAEIYIDIDCAGNTWGRAAAYKY